MRKFKTGATRDTDDTKNDYEGFLCPLVIEEFGNYMTVHRKQADGELRDSDNWQKGIPQEAYMKSMWRHFHQLWKLHRGYPVFDERDGRPIDKIEALMAVLFNVQGYAHEELKLSPKEKVDTFQKILGRIDDINSRMSPGAFRAHTSHENTSIPKR